MKRFRYLKLQLIIIYSLIYIFIIAFVSYNDKQTTYDMLSNRLYHDNALIVQNSEKLNWNQVQFDDKSYGLFVEINNFFRVQVTDSSERNPPMLSGYYPNNSENIPKAVVGKNIYKNNVVVENDSKWIECLNQKFEVAGVVGTDYASSCDDLAILFGADLNQYIDGKPVVIDAEDEKDLSVIADTILDKNPHVELMKRDSAGTARMTRNSYYFDLLFIEVILLIGSAILLLSKLEWEKYRNRRKVYFMLGIPAKSVIMCQILDILILNILSLIISIIFGNLINIYNVSMFKHILQIGFIILIFSCISILIFFIGEKIYLTNIRINLYKYLKKEGNHKCS